MNKILKEKLYSYCLCPVARDTESITNGDEEKLLTFEMKVLQKIHGPMRNLNIEYESREN